MTSLFIHIVALIESEVTDLMRGFVVSYVCGSIHYAIQQLSPSARLHCIHQRRHTSPKIHAVVQRVKSGDFGGQAVGPNGRPQRYTQ